MKLRIFLFCVTAAFVGVASAQTSGHSATPSHSAKDPLITATKPITPKTGISPHHKSSAAVLPAASTTKKTSVELGKLESHAAGPGSKKNKSDSANSSPKASTQARAGASPDPKIDFKYQSPKAGQKATNPGANLPNSAAPRVTKNH